MSKTKPKTSKPKTKPLTIAIHGDGIDIDAILSDSNGFQMLLKGLRDAADGVVRRGMPPAAAMPPSDADRRPDDFPYADALLGFIKDMHTPEALHKMEEALEVGMAAVRERLSTANAANGSTAHTS
jgi:hypothetical protein